MNKKNRIFSFLDVTIITVITSVIMCFLGGLLIYKHLGGIDYSLLNNDKNLQEFIATYQDLVDNYYSDLDKKSLIDGAISGMYSRVDDPYTTYLDPNDANSLNESLNGEYTGIGIRIGMDNEVVRIAEVFTDSPASKVGLQVGDVITNVNGEDVSGKTNEDISNMIKGTSNKKINLVVNRNGESITYDLESENLFVPVVTSSVLEKNGHKVGYIKLSIFNSTADVQFANALSKLENEGIESLIVDLRSNSGGYLQVSKNIAEMFIAKDKIIYSLQNKDTKSDYRDETSEKRNYKVMVVINKSSASASEILAAALKYSYGATLVGERSYGKGKVQEKASLTDGTAIKYTTAEWLTPSGRCIDGVGLTPDIEIELDAEAYIPSDINTDTQVMSALENLAG